MVCPYCSYEDDEEFLFCPECGKKSEDIKAVEEQEEKMQEDEEEIEEEQAKEMPIKGRPLNWYLIGLGFIATTLTFGLAVAMFINKNITPINVNSDEELVEAFAQEVAENVILEEIIPVNREITLMPGQTQQIEVYTFPQNANLSDLKWESSNENIKITSAGYVNSRAAGSEGTITISNKEGTVKTQCAVKVMSEQEAFFNTINLINTGDHDKNKLINFKENNFAPGPQLLYDRTEGAIEKFNLVNKGLPTYSVIQKQLINSETNNPIDCDVYMEGSTGDIRKIVTIEYLTDTLEITDYYFVEGKIYFMFRRQENYYRPVAAQQDFPGERFYFADDSLVKWREIIKNPSNLFEKTDYNYIENGFSWTTMEYKDMTNVDIEKQQYKKPGDDEDYKNTKEQEFKQKQKDMLNSAYNLYNKVLQTPSITELTGYIIDQNGYPMEGAHLKVFSEDYSILVAEAISKSDGEYTLKVPMHTKSYTIDITKPGYVATTIYNVDTSLNAISLFQESIYMYREGQGQYTIRLNLIDALDGYNIDEAKVIIRPGINNRDGMISQQFNLSDYGGYDPYYDPYDDGYSDYGYGEKYYDVRLNPGNYTAEVKAPGYTSTYFTISTISDGWEYHSSVVPQVQGDEVRVVLSWGANPRDLDSHLFFPDDQHIAYYNHQVGSSSLDRDDTDSYGPETITISNLNNGIYKYYVCDFTNAINNNYNSVEMSRSFAKVDVYNKNGLAGSFNVPTNKEGVIWHVFNIANGNILPVQRYYNNIEDMTWWSSMK